MSDFTPGPWVYETPEGLYRDPTSYIVRTTQGWESTVCQVVPDGTAEANARLIAAAPDMLRALEAYQAWTDASERAAFDNCMANLDAEDEASDRFNDLREAAIAKALGKGGQDVGAV